MAILQAKVQIGLASMIKITSMAPWANESSTSGDSTPLPKITNMATGQTVQEAFR